MHHDLKILSIWQHTFACGFQIRKNDRNFKANDTITFHLWNSDTEEYEGAETPTVCINEVNTDFPGLEPGYCVLIFTPPVPCRWRRAAEPIPTSAIAKAQGK